MSFVLFCRQEAELIGYLKSVSTLTWKNFQQLLKPNDASSLTCCLGPLATPLSGTLPPAGWDNREPRDESAEMDGVRLFEMVTITQRKIYLSCQGLTLRRVWEG